jgi:hypothetical protein
VKAVEQEASQPTESFGGLDPFADEFWGDRMWLEKIVFFEVAGAYHT